MKPKRLWLVAALACILMLGGLAYWWTNSLRVDIKNFSNAPVTVLAARIGWWPFSTGSAELKVYGRGGTVLTVDGFDHRANSDLRLLIRDADGSRSVSCTLKRGNNHWCRFDAHLTDDRRLICWACEPLM